MALGASEECNFLGCNDGGSAKSKKKLNIVLFYCFINHLKSYSKDGGYNSDILFHL